MTESIRILLVDDNPDDRALVRREVELLYPGASVYEVGTRKEFEVALQSAERDGEYDLIVTDLHLRWGTGREVLAGIRKTCPACPVIMFTGTGDEMTAVELMKAGLDDYVVKDTRQLPRLRTSIRLAVEGARNRSALSERERQLTAALAHKDIALREMHHRVKNNLQIIVSLLEMRARAKGEPLADELNDLAGRMRVLGQVQAKIYETPALDRVDFASTLGEIARDLVRVYGYERVSLFAQIEGPVELDLSRAMPLALLAYEVLLNSMKHAWPDGRRGSIAIELKKDGVGRELRISDDGRGFREDQANKGFGSRLTPALAAEAMAEIATSSEPGKGTTVVIRLQ